MGTNKYAKVANDLASILGLSIDQAQALAEKFEGNSERAVEWALDHAAEARSLKPASASDPKPSQTSGQSGTNTSQDADYKRALELSLQTANKNIANNAVGIPISEEEMQLQKALEASRQPSGVIDLTGDTPPGFAGEDASLQAAMLASIQGTDVGTLSMVSNDPVARQRDPNLPVGLKNVGNTCYLNSLLQTYFMMPQVRQRVLSLGLNQPAAADPKPDGAAPAKDDTTPFMKELQRMYSHLLASQEKYFDPSKLFKSLVDEQGNPVRIGSQEDVGEFNDLFLWRVSKGLAPPPSSEADMQVDDAFCSTMFDAEAVEVLVAKDESGEVKEVEKPVDIGRHLILPVGKGIKDLHQSMDQFMCDVMSGYRFDSGFEASEAHKFKWFKRLPTILMFQENRVHYDNGVQKKVNDVLKFDEIVYMDRYLHENKATTMERRAVVNQWRAEVATLEAQLDHLVNFAGSGSTVDKILDQAVTYLKQRQNRPGVEPNESEELTKIQAYLTRCSEQEQIEKKRLEIAIAELQQKIDAHYDDMKKVPYRLFAVWVHAGGAGSGHYWAHIRDTREGGSWRKFNDIHCSNVSQEDVFKDALGGSGITSAYFLIYMSEDEYQKHYQEKSAPVVGKPVENKHISAALVPEAWRKEIQDANAKLAKEVEESTKNSTDKKMERFMTSLTSKLRSAQEIANSYTLSSDMRVRNFPAFLMSGGLRDEAVSFLIKEHWVVEFSRGVEKDMESSAFQLACAKLAPIGGEETMRRAVDSAFNRDHETALKKQHSEFRTVFQIFSNALNQICESRYSEALKSLTVAHRRNEALPKETGSFDVSRRQDVAVFLQLCILACLDEVLNKPSKYAKNLWKEVVEVVRWAFPGEHPFMLGFRERFFSAAFEESEARNAEDLDAMQVIREIGEGLIVEEPGPFPFAQFSDPKPYDEPEQWEQLVSRTKDSISRAKKSVEVYEGALKEILQQDQIFPGDAPPGSKVEIVGLEALATSPASEKTNHQVSHVGSNTSSGSANLNNYDVAIKMNPDIMEVD